MSLFERRPSADEAASPNTPRPVPTNQPVPADTTAEHRIVALDGAMVPTPQVSPPGIRGATGDSRADEPAAAGLPGTRAFDKANAPEAGTDVDDTGTAADTPVGTDSRARTDAGTPVGVGTAADTDTDSAADTDIAADKGTAGDGQSGAWRQVLLEFVDHPREAVEKADRLVDDAVRTLTERINREHSGLRDAWHTHGEASTEDLRRALRGYRDFFEKVLSNR
ncbi:hypothetical protein [Pseudofrankia sp. BMG5.36]|uniref:hypothetical protein n=1 Tax=Pseudofrankia sp. BMG5.36 TaxID=1834512 RepID=UPI000A970AB3|nr:hypothetical protein [Pseudofrankia sp. BMG5.36]